ncbi:FadR/GntR family transcriptional regulator [Neobacillus sp. SM06]|uniref:FadR/GntR family transcriptional regulator n=1 Tax=Neobacillus sp. SM06 TaxID=3422492 RepID=UPI003D2870A6
MITNDRLKSGDKIPSERELSERLNVGRSSVREALRALELLGLIESRHGEGTFIRDFKGHQLVQLLSSFILQDEKAKQDVVETKHFIEMDCLRLLLQKTRDGQELSALQSWVESGGENDDEFFSLVAELADNYLIKRIWFILKDYYSLLSFEKPEGNKAGYVRLIQALRERDEEKTVAAYRDLRKLSSF